MKFLKIILPIFISMKLVANENELLDFNLEDDLNEISTIATKTKLNIDKMPSIVTILRGNELKLLGYNTLYEAISLLPGVELSIEPTGAKQVIFRGVKEKGKIKLLINGLNINNTYRGSIYHSFDMPIDMIERVEVIRGAGSVIYGTSAFVGVINVITKRDAIVKSQSFFVKGGSYDYSLIGFNKNFETNEFNVAVEGYFQKASKEILTGSDKAPLEISNAPGYTDERLKDYLIGATISNENLNIKFNSKSNEMGVAYGMSSMLQSDNDKNGIINRDSQFEVAYKNSFKDIDFTIKVGASEYEQLVDTRQMPSIDDLNDRIYYLSYKENSIYLDSFANFKRDNHDILFGIYGSYSKNKKSFIKLYEELSPEKNLLKSNENIKRGISQNVKAIYFQDLISVNENIDLSVGIRYDKYSNFGDAISPRVSAIYKYSDKMSFKVMYSRAFRAPSWIELYASIPGLSLGNEKLNAETIDSFEIASIYKEGYGSYFKTNIYYSKVNDIIYRDLQSRIYNNEGDNYLYGLESEYKRLINYQNEIYLNYTFARALDSDKKRLPFVAKHMLKGYYKYNPLSNFSMSTLFNYIGDRKREYSDSRKDLKGYLTLDQSFAYKFENGINLNASVKNIFDADIKYPATTGTYINDLPRESRTFYISLSKEF